jgi:hypothetical protein
MAFLPGNRSMRPSRSRRGKEADGHESLVKSTALPCGHKTFPEQFQVRDKQIATVRQPIGD